MFPCRNLRAKGKLAWGGWSHFPSRLIYNSIRGDPTASVQSLNPAIFESMLHPFKYFQIIRKDHRALGNQTAQEPDRAVKSFIGCALQAKTVALDNCFIHWNWMYHPNLMKLSVYILIGPDEVIETVHPQDCACFFFSVGLFWYSNLLDTKRNHSIITVSYTHLTLPTILLV